MLKNIPFYRLLSAYRDEKIHLTVPIYIFVGTQAYNECLKHKKMGTLATFVKVGETFDEYDWSILEGQYAIIMDTGSSHIMSLRKAAYLLLKNKARVVVLESNILKVVEVYNQKNIVR